jgi:uncharacterized protein (TIGR02145 family)
MNRFLLFPFFVVLILASAHGFGQSKGRFTDPRDKKVYPWIKIGKQVWMGRNMNYTVKDQSWPYNEIPAAGEKYGQLYTWQGAMKACPKGWHLPADSEFTELIDTLGGKGKAAGKLKQKGNDSWKYPNVGATDEAGFSALPAGYRHFSGMFAEITEIGYFWSSTENDEDYSFYRCISGTKEAVFRYSGDKRMGFSVRCVRDRK